MEISLSLFARYHIRHLLHCRRDRLRVIAAPGRALSASEDADLNALVEGLYLEDAEIERAFYQLNTLAQMHSGAAQQALIGGVHTSNSNQQALEEKILGILGLQLMPSAVLA